MNFKKNIGTKTVTLLNNESQGELKEKQIN